MTQEQKTQKQTPKAKEDRLKAALKANMAKRKAQARARSEQGLSSTASSHKS